jgi:hypothetical protein
MYPHSRPSRNRHDRRRSNPHGRAPAALRLRRGNLQLPENATLFVSFPYVYPEPELVN